MSRDVLFIAILVLSVSCAENRQAAIEPKAFFDLDSVLNAQTELFSEQNYQLLKQVRMDGTVEEDTLSPDSASWAEEFIIIRDFDLNKPTNVGAYETTESGGTIKYQLADNIDAPVKVFEVKKSPEGELISVTGRFYEDRSIYQHRRTLELLFDGSVLQKYQIKGFQNMILKDTINYSISGEVIAP